MRLKHRLISVLLFCSLLPLLLVFALTVTHTSELTKQLSIKAIQAQLGNGAMVFDRYFSQRKAELAVMVNDQRVQSMQFSQMLHYLQNEKNRSNGIYEKFIVGELDGSFYNTEGGNPAQGLRRTFNDLDPNARKKSLVQRDYWQIAIGQNTEQQPIIYVSEPMISYTTGIKQLVISASIINEQDTLVGLLAGSIPWQEIDRLTTIVKEKMEHSFTNKARVMVVSAHGAFIYHWDKDKVIHLRRSNGELVVNDMGEHEAKIQYITEQNNAELKAIGLRMLAGHSGYETLTNVEHGQVEHIFFAPIESADYSIAMILPDELMFAQVQSLQHLLWAVLAGVFVMVLFIAWWLTAKLYAPIKELTTAAQKLSSGHYDYPINSTGKDELGDLARAFKHMRKELEQREHNLEKRVLVRTEKLKEAEQQAQRSSHAKSRFLANMSHEIRTPLNGILGTIELLKESEDLSNEQTQLLHICSQSSNHLLNMINNILDLSKLEEGQAEAQISCFSVMDLVDSSMNMVKPLAAEKGLELNTNISPTVPQFVRSDIARLQQILINVLGNAIKFTDKGHVRLDIELQSYKSQDILKITVCDTGIGISEQDLERVFEPFKQAQGTSLNRYAGTGLGLSLCKELLALLGGSIYMESQLGTGTKVFITLPVEVADDGSEQEIGTVKQLPELLTGHVLLAEDNDVNLVVVSAMLVKLGLEVSTAKDGLLALELLKQRHFDLVLMDVNMPNLDGLETAKRIRQMNEFRHLPIIAFTANIFSEDINTCFNAGMDDFISKPVKLEKLKEVLARWLVC
ncbi:response regulator [Pseudoalteromonas sp. S16_S37]|uniref:response regulator n=1 Tax=Pseudoalteromonas sp. S16_S37 TaxID=2720228 RepID=UPI00167FF090|nr:response regulator [Pseudoalteromonas sp. S16_S37]MBD1581985.1 response regulator [Pseudoalteromonas sp. S16_S37]